MPVAKVELSFKNGKTGLCIKQSPVFLIELYGAQPFKARNRMLQLNLVESLGIDAKRIEIRTGRLTMGTHSGGNRNGGAENSKGFTEKLTRCLCNRTHFFLLLG